jgi:hypothetical protein
MKWRRAYECGASLEGYNDIKEGSDTWNAFVMEQRSRHGKGCEQALARRVSLSYQRIDRIQRWSVDRREVDAILTANMLHDPRIRDSRAGESVARPAFMRKST